jgi:hypothetical protein
LHNGSNHYQLIIGDPDTFDLYYDLPIDWYLGSGVYVDVNNEFTGLNLSVGDVVNTGATALAVKEAARRLGVKGIIGQGLGGPAGTVALALDIMSWFTFDTSYTVIVGNGPHPIIPAPTAPAPP